MECTLQRFSSKEFLTFVSQIPSNLPWDFENGALFSSEILREMQWVKLSCHGSDIYRRVHCYPHSQIADNRLIVKENVYYNICNFLHLDPCSETNSIVLTVENDDYFPDVAESAKVEPVLSIFNMGNEYEETLLHDYFSSPKYLHTGDIIQISLDNGFITKCAAYQGVSEVFFKVTSLSGSDAKEQSKNNEGVYLLKGYSDLYCLSGAPYYLPPKSTNLLCHVPPILSRVPPDLESYTSHIRSLFTPFIKNKLLDCLPFFILTGPNGCGKLQTIRLVGELMGLHVLSVNAYEFCNVVASAAEVKLDYLLEKALKIGPCILTISNFEWIGKDKHGQEDARFVDSFRTRCVAALKSDSQYPLFLVGITDCKPDELLVTISRAAVEIIKFSVLSTSVALEAIIWMTRSKSLDVAENALQPIVKKLAGFVHADLALLLTHAVRNKRSRTNSRSLELCDFEYALDLMEKAYSDTIGVAKVPDVKWDDVGGLTAIKEEIKLTLHSSAGGGRLRRSGILFYGPPGTGKTLMAKAVATECSMNFLSVKGPELMNMYVGQSEKNVREVFERAREAAPCVLFFDELDSLAPNRGKSDGGGVTDRVVSQLLAEMDGLHSNKGLFVIAATNRPDLVDSALLRPGRFDKMFYLGPLVDIESKLGVIKALTKKFTMSDDVVIERIAEKLSGHVTGADVYSVCSNAWLSAARRHLANIPRDGKVTLAVSMEDFDAGISQMVPSLTQDDLLYYQQLASSTSSK